MPSSCPAALVPDDSRLAKQFLAIGDEPKAADARDVFGGVPTACLLFRVSAGALACRAQLCGLELPGRRDPAVCARTELHAAAHLHPAGSVLYSACDGNGVSSGIFRAARSARSGGFCTGELLAFFFGQKRAVVRCSSNGGPIQQEETEQTESCASVRSVFSCSRLVHSVSEHSASLDIPQRGTG